MRRPPGMTCGDCGGRVVYTGRHLVCVECAWDLPKAPVWIRPSDVPRAILRCWAKQNELSCGEHAWEWDWPWEIDVCQYCGSTRRREVETIVPK